MKGDINEYKREMIMSIVRFVAVLFMLVVNLFINKTVMDCSGWNLFDTVCIVLLVVQGVLFIKVYSNYKRSKNESKI